MKPLDRRSFLHGSAGLALSTAVSAVSAVPGLTLAKAPGEQRFVVMLLRGGMDGLAAIAPYADLNFSRIRGPFALVPREDGGPLIELDAFFGLHPALAPVHGAYEDGSLLPIHAVGVSPNRSHFRAQDVLERGVANPNAVADGWLNRVLQQVAGSDPGTAVTMGRAIPKILRGPALVGSWAPERLPPAPMEFLDAVRANYREDALLGPALSQGLRLREETALLLDPDSRHADNEWNFPRVAETAGALLAASEGPRIGVLQRGGWDTHAGQGSAGGRIGLLFTDLAQALIALRGALQAVWDKTVVVVVTEFGRTMMANGSGGTDHGSGGAVFLYGGAVKGGRVLTDWPGLARGVSRRGADLTPTIAIWAVLKGVLRDHYGLDGNTLDEFIFPASRKIAPLDGLLRR